VSSAYVKEMLHHALTGPIVDFQSISFN